jgi:murein DD-endopeptidase MepM/ murein hydrolase activator NlpD
MTQKYLFDSIQTVSTVRPKTSNRFVSRQSPATWWQVLLLLVLGGLGILPSHAVASEKTLKISTKQIEGVTHFYVHNLDAADMTATFDMKLVNLNCSAPLPCTVTVAGGQTAEAFTLSPVQKSVPWDYRYTDTYTIGSATAQHDDNYIYSLPYAAGETFSVSQGYHGRFSHTGPDEYSIDWKMPPGTPVHAARGGVVVQSKDDSNVGGPNRKFQNLANCVMIRHSDGTIGIYAHLQKSGNRVKVGDRVNVGDWIAMSGNTGFTSGPHLHFSVFKTKSGKERESLPVKFQTSFDSAVTLVEGKSYQSLPVTQPARIPTAVAIAIPGKKKG